MCDHTRDGDEGMEDKGTGARKKEISGGGHTGQTSMLWYGLTCFELKDVWVAGSGRIVTRDTKALAELKVLTAVHLPRPHVNNQHGTLWRVEYWYALARGLRGW